MLEISDPRDLLILSAAMQVFHYVSPELAGDALSEHEELLSDEVVSELEKRIVDLANQCNHATRDALPEGATRSSELPMDLRPYGVWGSHAVTGARSFYELTSRISSALIGAMRSQNN